jgi:hypothetical protein
MSVQIAENIRKRENKYGKERRYTRVLPSIKKFPSIFNSLLILEISKCIYMRDRAPIDNELCVIFIKLSDIFKLRHVCAFITLSSLSISQPCS